MHQMVVQGSRLFCSGVLATPGALVTWPSGVLSPAGVPVSCCAGGSPGWRSSRRVKSFSSAPLGWLQQPLPLPVPEQHQCICLCPQPEVFMCSNVTTPVQELSAGNA